MRHGAMTVLLALPFLCPAADRIDLTAVMAARNSQNTEALARLAQGSSDRARKQAGNAEAQYHAALELHYLAEVNLERQDKRKAREAAESGIDWARKAVALQPRNAEFHRLLGALCGQVIPANVLAGLKYGQCALESVNKAIELDPKSSNNWLSHGVGNFYLPETLGGGVSLAIKDFQKAIDLNPKNADAWAWMGVALRRAKRFEESKKALQRSLDLNPKREWARTQMIKTLLRQ
jgi:tetratricopeptide (TPR) repeat protein